MHTCCKGFGIDKRPHVYNHEINTIFRYCVDAGGRTFKNYIKWKFARNSYQMLRIRPWASLFFLLRRFCLWSLLDLVEILVVWKELELDIKCCGSGKLSGSASPTMNFIHIQQIWRFKLDNTLPCIKTHQNYLPPPITFFASQRT